MKIGDKVRFLNDIGGGRVAGFQGRDIVLVEDNDGFQIPTLMKDVVVVATDNYDSSKVHTSESGVGYAPKRATPIEVPEEEPADRIITYKKKAEERKDGDKLSAYLAFVPQDIHAVTSTMFDLFFVNDSNYYMSYILLTADGASWTLKSSGEVEPNTTLFIEELGRDRLNELGRVSVSLMAYKREKSFMIKSSVDVQFRLDPVKFYKLHTFRENIFFEQPALLYTIIENDKTTRPLVIDADRLKAEMYSSAEKDTPDTNGPKRDQLVRRYDATQSKSKPMKQSSRDADAIVVDLHAGAILDTTAGMKPADILNYQLDVFRRTLDEHRKEKGRKIIFIHGKGEGVLRHAILHELNYKYKQYPYQDASFQEYGYGATQVTIR